MSGTGGDASSQREPPSTSRVRWGDDPPENARDARLRLLDAAEACFERYSTAKTTIDDIATAAHVSRPTVYRYFPGGRDEIILAVLLRETDRFNDVLRAAVKARSDPADALLECLVITVTQIPNEPRLKMLFTVDVAGQTARIVGSSEAMTAAASKFFIPLLERAAADGSLRPEIEPEAAVEFLMREMVSLLTVQRPQPHSEQSLRRYLEMFVIGALFGEKRVDDQ